MNDVIIINVDEKVKDNNQNENFSQRKDLLFFSEILHNYSEMHKLPDIFVVCTQYTYTSETNFQKLFEALAKSEGYELLKDSKIGGITSKYSIQTTIYIKNTINKNNIKNIKFDLLDLGSNFGCIYLYFEYNFYKINVFNSDTYDKDHESTMFSKSSINILQKQKSDIDIFKKSKQIIIGNNNNIILFDTTNYKQNLYQYFPQKQSLFGVNKRPKVISGFYYILEHKNNKINSLTIININEEGLCFNEDQFTIFYDNNISSIDTDLIIVCSQNSISRKLNCKHFQTLLRENIEQDKNNPKYILKNKKNSSGLINISRHLSIGELSSLGIRTRVYFKQNVINPSLLNIVFKSINFTGSYGSILCSIEYNGQKMHVINSCFFDKETLGILKKSYKNEKIDEYMKIIKEFELVKKFNDDLFFVGHNIKFNLSCRFANINRLYINTSRVENPNYELVVNKNNSSNKKEINIVCKNNSSTNFNSEINKYKQTLTENNKPKIPKIKLLFTKYNNYIKGTKYNYSINSKEINVSNKKIPLEFLTLSYKTNSSGSIDRSKILNVT